jgi:citrate synthase
MAEYVNVKNTGLRGIPVADTKISFIDGEKGILIYRGFRIEELAERATFLEVAYLLLNGQLPSAETLKDFEERTAKARPLPGYILECFRRLPKEAHPMDVLQATVPLLAMADPDLGKESREAHVNMAVRLIARFPTAVAAWHRIRQGLDPLEPDPSLSHAADLLRQLHGKMPDEEMARAMDVCLILHADHTFNASTFACREVASTRAHMYAGVTAGIGALSGSLHGGANAEVMKMLLELETEKDIPGWVKKQLESGNRIMGMGHAVYKTMDPRAKYLKEMGWRLGRKTGQAQWPALSAQVEEAGLKEFAARGKTEIQPNVDFFSAPVYHIMGVPRDLMTPIFAISRVSGWCSHIIEEKFAEAQEKPQLYRPQAEYVGRYCGLMGCEWEPVEARS